MEYKVTAFRDVTIRAFVRYQIPQQIGDQVVMRPAERQEWISLKAGEVKGGLGMVIGVHPQSVPTEIPVHITGVPMIQLEGWSNDELPKEFLGLFRLEAQEWHRP